VGSAEQANQRARVLLAEPFEGSIGEGELKIPAIRGIGDSLLYFVDRYGDRGEIYDVDFVSAQTPDDTPELGLLRVDHLDQAVAPTELLSWVMYYRSMLGLAFEAQHDIPDLYGMIDSRSLVSPDLKLRMSLSASQAGMAATSRFLSQYHGSGVQQIALECKDIFAASESMDPSVVLPIPANYYDDLAAKFGLEPAQLERMRAANILYDRSSDGELFHLYTQSVNGIYFEVLQRNNYGGYGSVNGPVRLAAQAQYDAEINPAR